jgi:hypothetical protein
LFPETVDRVALLLEAKLNVVSFHSGLPEPELIEAGGHRSTFTGVDMGMQPGLMSLLPQVVDAVRVPVIAAGGIADGRTVAAAFMLGASAVQTAPQFSAARRPMSATRTAPPSRRRTMRRPSSPT